MTQSRREIRAAQLAEDKRNRRAAAQRPNSGPETVTDDGDALEFRAGGRGGGDGRTGWRRWVIPTLKWGSLAGVVLFVLGIAGIWFAYSQTSVPQPNEFVGRQVSIVYYSDGKTEIDRIVQDEGNRQMVDLAKVPDHVQKAHIAAEDRTFYVNNGISVGGIFRAVKTSITGETQVGGSTITQQYVKNYFLSQDRTLERKAKEILIAMKIDGEKSKDEILGDYLNTIYYGRGAYGIQTAAQAYFGKSGGEADRGGGRRPRLGHQRAVALRPRQGREGRRQPRAALRLCPRRHGRGGLAVGRRAGQVHRAAGDQGVQGATAVPRHNRLHHGRGEEELAHIGLTDQDIAKGGLRIVTTIDRKAQSAAVKSMGKHLPKGVQGGLVAIKPGDGAVVAMYGGSDYSKQTAQQRHPGHHAGRLELQALHRARRGARGTSRRRRSSTATRPKEFDGYPHPVNNYDDRDYGKVDMRRMIGRSINTAFVELNEEIGPDKTRQAAVDAGIPDKTLGLKEDLGNVLGTASPRVIDMASAYSTIAAQGSAPRRISSPRSRRRTAAHVHGQARDPPRLRQGGHG